MLERFENCESVFVEKTDAKDFSRFTPAIVRKPEDLVLPPFTADYFENNGSLEKLPILPERGNPANIEVGDILRLFGENWLRENGVSREQGKVVSRLSACRTHVLGGHVEQCDSECENCFSPSAYAKNDFCTPAATATARNVRAWPKRNGWRPEGGAVAVRILSRGVHFAAPSESADPLQPQSASRFAVRDGQRGAFRQFI